ncbi:hypothetical protein B6U80_01830 [Candidatus Pacearchaeota archaeon ex4484_26]|nr:MAG: hypothetical protein B6U80_01830 [Candidatus Pacearchaeota archaeon ex4484_26]RLG13196.1 MAG: hypothetical protein DRN69_06090 [Candidatus Pacearchaeota archaeon]
MSTIIKIPVVNALGKTNGCEKAPDVILQEMEDIYSTEDLRVPIYDTQKIKINLQNLEETNETIYKEAKKFLQRQGRIIFLGGDHSISYSLVRAFFETHQDAGLLVLDAHADCMNNFKPPTHEDWLRTLLEERIVKPENVLLVGLRNLHPIERDFLNENKVNSFSAREIFESGLKESAHSIMGIMRMHKNLYLSLDIDVVDPAFAPAVSYPEPGGLTTRELLHFIQKILLLKNLKAADIVEVNPEKDNALTVKLAAKIVTELL